MGFLFGTAVAVRFLSAVGHIRVFAALASTASSAAILHALWVNPVTWALLRLVFGLCLAGLFVVVESWLNDMATNANRGRILGGYMVVMMGGLSAGQLLLAGGDPAGFELFVLVSVLVSLALVPITLSATTAPAVPVLEPLSLRRLLATVPTVAVAITADRVEPTQITSAGATLVRLTGVGAAICPAATGTIMGAAGPSAFFVVLAAVHAVVAAYVGYQIIARDTIPVDEQTAYMAVSARATAVTANLHPDAAESASPPAVTDPTPTGPTGNTDPTPAG